MKNRYYPSVDKLFYWIAIPTNILFIAALIPMILLAPKGLTIMIPTIVFTDYFLISPLFGYVELREDELFIKYGFFLKKEIPYGKIRSIKKNRSIISEATMSLKNALDHIEIRYNKFDITIVSLKNTDNFLEEIEQRRKSSQ